MKWITREKAKVDRIACPWLIRKFVVEHGSVTNLSPVGVGRQKNELGVGIEITMSDGTIVRVDGTVKRKDATEFHLQNGEMILMDGHLMKGGKPAAMSQ